MENDLPNRLAFLPARFNRDFEVALQATKNALNANPY